MWIGGIPGRGKSTSKDLEAGRSQVHSEDMILTDAGSLTGGVGEKGRLGRGRGPWLARGRPVTAGSCRRAATAWGVCGARALAREGCDR